MMSRTTPVGVIVLAVAGIFAVGCTAQTSAVFEALLDPASAQASPSEADVDRPGVSDAGGPTWWPHPDGYRLQLPGGWSGVSLNHAQGDRLLDALASDYPGLAGRIEDALDATHSDVSMVAADTSIDSEFPPLVVVLLQSTEKRKARHVKTRTYEQIAALPGLRGPIIRGDERLPNDVVVRYDYVIEDADLGPVRVRSYLFRFGVEAYLVNFVASESDFESSEATFDDIVSSIRIGV